MSLVKTPKSQFQFEVNEGIEVNPTQTIRARKNGIDVDLSVQLVPIGKAELSKNGSREDSKDIFIKNIEVGKEYMVGGDVFTVTKVTKRKITLQDAESELNLTPVELFNQSE